MEVIIVFVIVAATALLAGGLIAKNLIHVCGPNEALVFSVITFFFCSAGLVIGAPPGLYGQNYLGALMVHHQL